VSDMSARILLRMSVSVSVSASWNAGYIRPSFCRYLVILLDDRGMHMVVNNLPKIVNWQRSDSGHRRFQC